MAAMSGIKINDALWMVLIAASRVGAAGRGGLSGAEISGGDSRN
jgi:hypothetical protein